MFALAKGLVVALVMAGSAGMAASATYDCTTSSNAKRSKYGKGSYIAPTIRLVVDEAAGTASVYDAVIAEQKGGPIAAEFTRRDDGKLRFEWSLYVAFRKNRNALADYSLTLNPARMTASIRVAVHGEFQDTLGKARCAVAK